MGKRTSLILALMITGMFPVLTLNAWLNRPVEYTEQGAIDAALYYLKTSPTFRFDGIEETIEVEETRILESYPIQYIVIISFDSRHAGYGDRAGQVLAQVVTPHSAWIKVVNGEVVSAVLDNTWDELSQEFKQSELIPIEQARDLVIQHILEKYDITVPVPEEWTFAILTPEGLVGASTQQFVGGGWEMNISFPAVITPIYAFSVSYTGDVDFTWEGTVDQLCNVRETSTSLRPNILMPEDARDIAVEYVIENMEAMKGVETPSGWIGEETTPSGLLGFSSRRYMCGGWTVNVSWPVVWKPTYQVEIEYTGEFTYSWEGTVDQSGNVEEK
jgi:hypothetical protein